MWAHRRRASTPPAEAGRRLADAGFTRLDELQQWPAGAGKFFVIRDGAIIAWVVPESATATTAFNILGAHTDSPSFKLKPKPTTRRFGWLQAGVEVYGGPLLNSWLDRELQLAGRLVVADGTETLVATGPLLRFPQLAIHLDRAVNDGLTLDKQQHMNPVWGLGDPASADLLGTPGRLVAGAVDPAPDRRLSTSSWPTPSAGAVFGANGEFFASGRLDNLSSVHAGLGGAALRRGRRAATDRRPPIAGAGRLRPRGDGQSPRAPAPAGRCWRTSSSASPTAWAPR